MNKHTKYDPWEHAESLGLQVFVRRLRNANGRWFPDFNEILLGDHLEPWAQRCVLAHEVGHAILGHRGSTPENEWAADRFAALNLISGSDLSIATRNHGADLVALRKELGVTSSLLRSAFSPFAA